MINKPYLMMVGAISAMVLSGCEPLGYSTIPEIKQEHLTSASLSAPRELPFIEEGEPGEHKRDRDEDGKYKPVKYGDDDFGKSDGKVGQHSKKPGKYPDQDSGWPDDRFPDEDRLPDDEDSDLPGSDYPDIDFPDSDFPGVDRNSNDHASSDIAAFSRCRSTDPRTLCLKLKFVSYRDRAQQPEALQAQLAKTLSDVNQIWNSCGIEFQLDQFKMIHPPRHGLQSITRDYSEFTRIRKTFQDDRHFLVVATSNWNRDGSLGNSHANAWTTLPGERFHGVIVERRAAYDPNVIAHELGHYLSLDHHSDRRDVMSPVIHAQSRQLTASQCRAARSAAKTFWNRVMR